jgi:hypothetical protein
MKSVKSALSKSDLSGKRSEKKKSASSGNANSLLSESVSV